MGVVLRGPPPGQVVVEGQTHLTVLTHGVVFTHTLQPLCHVLLALWPTLSGVTVTLTSGQGGGDNQ